jgi:hypothetical protein
MDNSNNNPMDSISTINYSMMKIPNSKRTLTAPDISNRVTSSTSNNSSLSIDSEYKLCYPISATDSHSPCIDPETHARSKEEEIPNLSNTSIINPPLPKTSKLRPQPINNMKNYTAKANHKQ